MKDYMAMFNEAMNVVESLGIETGNIVDVKLNYRAKNRFGQCRKNNVNNTYSLNLKEECNILSSLLSITSFILKLTLHV